MKIRIGIAVVLFFAVLPFYWDKTKDPNTYRLAEAGSTGDILPPLVFATSLYDSLPHNIVDMLKLGDVEGTKVKYRSGAYAAYYHYSADREQLLRALTLTPVPVWDVVADTSYHHLIKPELDALCKSIPFAELDYDEGFWSAPLDQFDIIESIKPPYRHVFLISKSDQMVFHRVAPMV